METISYRVDLGGNYYMEFICSREKDETTTFPLLLAVLIDGAHINPEDKEATYEGLMVSIDAPTAHEAIKVAKFYLVNLHGTHRVLNELMYPDGGETP